MKTNGQSTLNPLVAASASTDANSSVSADNLRAPAPGEYFNYFHYLWATLGYSRRIAQIQDETAQLIHHQTAQNARATSAAVYQITGSETAANTAAEAVRKTGKTATATARAGIFQAADTASDVLTSAQATQTTATEEHDRTSPIDDEIARAEAGMSTAQQTEVESVGHDSRALHYLQKTFETILNVYIKLSAALDGIGAGFGLGMIYGQAILILTNKIKKFDLTPYSSDPLVVGVISAISVGTAIYTTIRTYYTNRYQDVITLRKLDLTQSSMPTSRVTEQGLRTLARGDMTKRLIDTQCKGTLLQRLLEIEWRMGYLGRALNQIFTAFTLGDFIALLFAFDKKAGNYLGFLAGLWAMLAIYDVLRLKLEHNIIGLANEIVPARDAPPENVFPILPNGSNKWQLILATLPALVQGVTLGVFWMGRMSSYVNVLKEAYPWLYYQAKSTIDYALTATAGTLGLLFYAASAWLYGTISQVRINSLAQCMEYLLNDLDTRTQNNTQQQATEIQNWLCNNDQYFKKLISDGKEVNIPYSWYNLSKEEILIILAAAFKQAAFTMMTATICVYTWVNDPPPGLMLLLATWLPAIALRTLESHAIIMRDRLTQDIENAVYSIADRYESLNMTVQEVLKDIPRQEMSSSSQGHQYRCTRFCCKSRPSDEPAISPSSQYSRLTGGTEASDAHL